MRRGSAGQRRSRARGFVKPVQVDRVLAQLVGQEPLPRTEILKRLWAYIKAHDLQVVGDGRQIQPDEQLGAVLGRRQVSMFEMPRLMNDHIVGHITRHITQ